VSDLDTAVEYIVRAAVECLGDGRGRVLVGIVRDAVECGVKLGARHALEECRTCGGTGLMGVEDLDGDGRVIRAKQTTCGECAGTGVGLMGQLLAEEREACARLAESPAGEWCIGDKRLPYWDGEKTAAAIRSRGEGKGGT
jgi:hypothetical protein